MTETMQKGKNSMELEEKGEGYLIYRDKLTGIMYFCPDNGGACIMIDAEGNPLVCNERAAYFRRMFGRMEEK